MSSTFLYGWTGGKEVMQGVALKLLLRISDRRTCKISTYNQWLLFNLKFSEYTSLSSSSLLIDGEKHGLVEPLPWHTFIDDLCGADVGFDVTQLVGGEDSNGFSTGWIIDGMVPFFLFVFAFAFPLSLNVKLATGLVGGDTTLILASTNDFLVNSSSSFRLILNSKWISPSDTKCFNVLWVSTAHFSDSIISWIFSESL